MRNRSFLAVVLCCAGVMVASGKKPVKPANEEQRQAKLFQKKLNGDQQILHALDRLTFGPRPSDVAQVKKMGLKKWIDLQLHPERIRESANLEAKLEPLESLRMSPLEVVQHYPAPQMLLAIAQGRQPMPEDPLLRASVQRMMQRYKARRDSPGQGAPNFDPNAEMEPARRLNEVLNPSELLILRGGSQDQKRALLANLPPERLEEMLIAMPRPQRQQLVAIAPVQARRTIMLLNAPQQVVAYDLLDAKLLRAIESNRQLAEELDDFWFNHFNVFYDKGSDRFSIPEYEREAIRPQRAGQVPRPAGSHRQEPGHAVLSGQLRNLSGPTLTPRTRTRKVKRGLNENYGRELMELHTLGVERRLHAEGRHRSGALLHRLDHSRAAAGRRILLQRQAAR